MSSVRVVDARMGAIALLLGVGAVGLRSWQGLRHVSTAAVHPPSAPVLLAFAALEATAAVAVGAAIAVVWRRPRRRRPDEWRIVTESPHGAWARLAGLLFALVMLAVLAVPFALLATVPRPAPSGERPAPSYRPAPPRTPAAPRHDTSSGPSPVPVVVTVLAVGTAALLLIRSRRAAPTAASGAEPSPRPEHPLVPAVAAAQRALDRPDAPRSAVIACYTAMEHALARSGAPPADADTPADVLNRAASAGLVRSGAAATLTRLFREARYSAHPIGEEHRRAARTALSRLRHDLEATP